MNRCMYLLFVALLLVASLFFMACDEHHSRATALLCRADSLTASCPDSAFRLLESCKSEIASWPESQQMRFHLLHAKAQNKAYVPFTSDTMMNAAVDYYDRNGTVNERMEAHYLLGCVYRDLSDAPKALSAYHDALECADTTADDCNYNILSRVYAQMSDLFYYQNLFENQLASLDRASHYSYLAKDTFAAQLIYSQKMDAYKMLMLPDSMLYVSEKASNYFREAGYNEMAAGISFVPVRYLLDCGEITKAKEYMDLFEHESGLFDENNNIEPGREVYYYTKGYYYLKTSQYDSAEYFFRKELITGKDFNNQNAGSRGLALLFQKIHKPDSAAKYALYSYEMNDSVYHHEATAEVARMKSLFDYSRYERQAQKERERAEAASHRFRLFSVVMVFSLVMISLLAGLAVFVQRSKRRYAVKQYQLKSEQLKNANQSLALLREQGEASAQVISEKERDIVQLQAEIDKLLENRQLRADSEKAMLADSEIGHLISSKSASGQKITESEWEQIGLFVKENMSGFSHFLAENHSSLGMTKKRICILLRLYAGIKDTAVMLGVSAPYVSQQSGEILSDLFQISGSGKKLADKLRQIQ